MEVSILAVKQVIVIRKDLGMRRGKEIAQGAHASHYWMVERLQKYWFLPMVLIFRKFERDWMAGGFTKVVLQVDTEEKLYELYQQAKEAGLTASLIQDIGKTEFKIPTFTACCIGPNNVEKIDRITGGLKLY